MLLSNPGDSESGRGFSISSLVTNTESAKLQQIAIAAAEGTIIMATARSALESNEALTNTHFILHHIRFFDC